MSRRINIKKLFAAIAWCIAGAGLLILLGAAMKARQTKKCLGLEVAINGEVNGEWFINKKEVLSAISKDPQALIGKSMNRINLMKMEAALEKNIWIRDADLFFDNNGILQVSIRERRPIARIFSSPGLSFYIDSSCRKLPLSRKTAVKLPVFTGYMYGMGKPAAADSLLLSDIRSFSRFMMKNPFWMAQITQVHITPDREFEMVPLIGDHIIEFGKAEGMAKKFRRLMIFYNKVLSKIGMDHYSRLKLQYDNEVVGVRNEKNGPLPSINPEPVNPVLPSADEEAPIEDVIPGKPDTKEVEPPVPDKEKQKENKESDRTSIRPTIHNPVSKTNNPVPAENKRKTPKAVMPERH